MAAKSQSPKAAKTCSMCLSITLPTAIPGICHYYSIAGPFNSTTS